MSRHTRPLKRRVNPEDIAAAVVWLIDGTDAVTGQVIRRMERLALYPAKHFVTPEPRLQAALGGIRQEMVEQVERFKAEGKLLEAQRIRQRTLSSLAGFMINPNAAGVRVGALRVFCSEIPVELPLPRNDGEEVGQRRILATQPFCDRDPG